MLDIRNTLLMAQLVKALKRASTQFTPPVAWLVKSWDGWPEDSVENSLSGEQIGGASVRRSLGGLVMPCSPGADRMTPCEEHPTLYFCDVILVAAPS